MHPVRCCTRAQAPSEQRRHKLSYRLQHSSPEDAEAVLCRLRHGLASAGLEAKVVHSGGVDVDILAHGAGKGSALEFLLQALQRAGASPIDGVQVNGDSGNDAELLDVPGVRGCVVGNAHSELLAHAQQARAAGRGSSIHLASQPCAGGIVEALLAFGSLPAPGAAAPASPGALLRSTVIELAMLQSNALAGNLALLSEPRATWITPSGELLRVVSCRGGPADAAAAGLTWADAIAVRCVSDGTAVSSTARPEPGALLLVTYQLWSFKGQARDSERVRLCSALVRAVGSTERDGFKLVHLHETVMLRSHTATAAFAALAVADDGDSLA